MNNIKNYSILSFVWFSVTIINDLKTENQVFRDSYGTLGILFILYINKDHFLDQALT